MPYKIIKKKCKQSTGKKGNYVMIKKSDSKKQSCHTTKEKAKSAIKAKYANEIVLTEYIELLIESNKNNSFKKELEDAIKREEKRRIENNKKEEPNTEDDLEGRALAEKIFNMFL